MDISDYLARRLEPEPMPAWLADFNEASHFTRNAFFAHRTVFYPGSGMDHHALQLFAGAHAAHAFIQVDYGVSRQQLEAQLADPGVDGYQTLRRLSLEGGAFAPDGWIPHVRSRVAAIPGREQHVLLESRNENPEAYAFLEVLQRQPSHGEAQGPARLAVLYLSADGVAAYDAFYCQKYPAQNPFAVVLQDQFFGGNNYTKFGEGGLLAELALRCRTYPDYLLAAKNTPLWQGFARIPGLSPDRGGARSRKRYLAKA